MRKKWGRLRVGKKKKKWVDCRLEVVEGKSILMWYRFFNVATVVS